MQLNVDTANLPQVKQPLWNWLDILLIIIGIAAFFLLGFTVFGLYFQLVEGEFSTILEPSILSSLALTGIEFFALTASVYFLGMRRKKLAWTDVGFKALSVGWLIAVLVISIVVIPLSGLISALTLVILDQPLINPQLDFLIPEGFTWVGALGMLILGGIAVPFAEELIFRGVIYKWLRDSWGIWPGILISSLIFGIVHVEISVVVAAFFLGIILALAYEYSRSLWSAVLIHAVNNSVKIGLLYAIVALGIDITI
ncbi:MAG: CPBP family intramembrane metalloprotease [Anaerolineales bacterium]|nr:CPBP family intramembrane metalloprotease [Anaerolineales bacterium]